MIILNDNRYYNIDHLVYYEQFFDIGEAIAREKQIKAGSRQKKINLINKFNPEWRDLYFELWQAQIQSCHHERSDVICTKMVVSKIKRQYKPSTDYFSRYRSLVMTCYICHCEEVQRSNLFE